MKIIRNDFYKSLIVALLSLLAFIGNSIHTQQTDIASRLRIVELNQARIMERMGIEPMAAGAQSVQKAALEADVLLAIKNQGKQKP